MNWSMMIWGAIFPVMSTGIVVVTLIYSVKEVHKDTLKLQELISRLEERLDKAEK